MYDSRGGDERVVPQELWPVDCVRPTGIRGIMGNQSVFADGRIVDRNVRTGCPDDRGIPVRHLGIPGCGPDGQCHSLGHHRPSSSRHRPQAAAFGVREPRRPAAFLALVENHYRYYQFYANSLVAGAMAYAAHFARHSINLCQPSWPTLGFILLELVLLAGSRDALRKYYMRVERLLGNQLTLERSANMTNGFHKEKETSVKKVQEKPASAQKPSKTKPPETK